MIIRDAAEADLPAIVEIYNAAILTRMSTAQLEPVTVAERLAWFREHSPERYPIWVTDDAGKIAGWFSFSRFIKRAAYDVTAEVSVYVHEDFQRQGVAAHLLDKAIYVSPSLGFESLIGFIFAHNLPSLELFHRFGFERWGMLPRVARAEGIWRDVVIVGGITQPNE